MKKQNLAMVWHHKIISYTFVSQLKIEKSAVEELNNVNVIVDSKRPKMIKAVNLH